MDIQLYAKNVVSASGIWYSRNKSVISYPDEGNANCFQFEDDSFWFRHRNNCIVELVKRFPPGGCFFDIGGGNGFVGKAVQDQGIETVVVEPGEEGCINARKRGLRTVVCATLEDADFELNSLPAAGIFDVLEHIKADTGFLKSLHNYLRSGGLLFITVPAYRFLWSNEDTDGGHFYRYTLRSLSRKLMAAGYKIEYASYFFSLLPLPIFLFRTIPSWLGMNKNSTGLKKSKDEHKSNSKLLEKVWNRELERIKRGKTIPFGGSCLVVARKLAGR